MLYCLIALVLGYLLSRQMGNGFSVGGQECIMRNTGDTCRDEPFNIINNLSRYQYKDDNIDYAPKPCGNGPDGDAYIQPGCKFTTSGSKNNFDTIINKEKCVSQGFMEKCHPIRSWGL